MVMKRKLPRTLSRLWQRYNPRRSYLDLDEELIALMSQMGYVELYRGEWFFTDAGIDMMLESIREFDKSYGGTE